ncbi:MAG TPA: HK97 family phage prohead protease [Caulobacterales bacterium]|nr:HK97 family phage prohead protease [Caulobacterales bacterium]
MMFEGYAALFGVADQVGDIIRAGAFRASLARRSEPLPLLAEHEPRLLAGYWDDVREDGRGLFVRGALRFDLPGAARARRLLERGIDGLSIGFVPVLARKTAQGRALDEIDLLEVSLVTFPMQPLARLRQSPVGDRLPTAV